MSRAARGSGSGSGGSSTVTEHGARLPVHQIAVGPSGVHQPAQRAAGRPAGEGRRRSWHLRANAVVLLYLALALVAVALHDHLPVPRWLAIHLLLLGAATNAIITWGEHFAVALLRAPQPTRRRGAVRLAALNLGVVGVLLGVAAAVPALTVVAAGLLGVIVLWHVTSLVLIAHRALQGRFASTVRFYVVAGVALVVGIVFGVLLATGSAGQRYEAFHAAHVHANLLGWVGLTVLGTLFTLWPTVLRTRIVEGVEGAAASCLKLTGTGLLLVVTGLAADLRPVAVAGLGMYACGVAVALRPFVATWRRKAPREPASWSLAAATCWLLVGVLADFVLLARSQDVTSYVRQLDALVPLLLVGFVAQVLVGALTYLLPVLLGGGPSAVRAGIARLARAGPLRVAMLNTGVPLLALPVAPWARILGWALVLVPVIGFLVLVVSLLVPPRPSPLKGHRHGLRDR